MKKLTRQEGLTPIVAILILIVALSAGWYLYKANLIGICVKETQVCPDGSTVERAGLDCEFTACPTPKDNQDKIMAFLESDWSVVQELITLRPSYHNQTADDVWREPSKVQFIDDKVFLVSVEDDDNTHVVVMAIEDNTFVALKTFENVSYFEKSDWQDAIEQYGDSSYLVTTYAMDLVVPGDILIFDELTKVQENIFIKNYWEETD